LQKKLEKEGCSLEFDHIVTVAGLLATFYDKMTDPGGVTNSLQ